MSLRGESRLMNRPAVLLILMLATPALAAEDKVAPIPIVEACVDAQGKLVSARIIRTSGQTDVDEAALKIARANKYSPGKDSRQHTLELSCIKFKVKIILEDG